MASGIDWFRWHHGTVSDQKFQLVAKRAGASVAEAIAVWATLLEAASQAERRGSVGQLDFEAIDCALGLADGRTAAVHVEFRARRMIDANGQLLAWDKRQPKREREQPDSSAGRVQKHRAKKRQETPRNASNGQETPRGEESRREDIDQERKAPPSSAAAQPTAPADMAGHKAARLAAVTQDAITAFNAILAKPTGLLPAVHKSVGRDKRQKQVGRCLKVVREICQDQYGSTVITPQFWEAYFGACAEDPFKSGKQPPGKGHENWTPTFEYLTREAVVLEVYDKSGAGEEAA